MSFHPLSFSQCPSDSNVYNILIVEHIKYCDHHNDAGGSSRGEANSSKCSLCQIHSEFIVSFLVQRSYLLSTKDMIRESVLLLRYSYCKRWWKEGPGAAGHLSEAWPAFCTKVSLESFRSVVQLVIDEVEAWYAHIVSRRADELRNVYRKEKTDRTVCVCGPARRGRHNLPLLLPSILAPPRHLRTFEYVKLVTTRLCAESRP